MGRWAGHGLLPRSRSCLGEMELCPFCKSGFLALPFHLHANPRFDFYIEVKIIPSLFWEGFLWKKLAANAGVSTELSLAAALPCLSLTAWSLLPVVGSYFYTSTITKIPSERELFSPSLSLLETSGARETRYKRANAVILKYTLTFGKIKATRNTHFPSLIFPLFLFFILFLSKTATTRKTKQNNLPPHTFAFHIIVLGNQNIWCGL